MACSCAFAAEVICSVCLLRLVRELLPAPFSDFITFLLPCKALRTRVTRLYPTASNCSTPLKNPWASSPPLPQASSTWSSSTPTLSRRPIS